MKNILQTKLNLGWGFAFALAIAAWLPAGCATSGTDMADMKGGEHMLMLNRIETTQGLNALKTDDSIAMVCAKCKTVWSTRVQQGVKGAQILNEHGQPTELIGTHPCTACGSTLTVTGHAKGDITELQHTCGACGADSAFCCAVKPGGGSTKGMEKK